MRIGIDAREMMGRPTGVGRYLSELLRAWSAPDPGFAARHEFVLLRTRAADRRRPRRLRAARAWPNASCRAPAARRGSRLALRRAVALGPPRRLLRPGVHRTARHAVPAGRDGSRPLVLRASRVVLVAGRDCGGAC